jgi:hypothetical protein
MAVSDWVPIASVAATAAVALGVPFITARLDIRRIRAQADEARLDELRGVIDDAGTELRSAILAFGDTTTELRALNFDSGPVLRSDHRPDPVQSLQQYQERVKALCSWESRLATRVGTSDPLHTAYARAVEHLNDVLLPFSEIVIGDQYDSERSRDIENARKAAVDAQGEFNDAAAQRVGLPSPPRRN